MPRSLKRREPKHKQPTPQHFTIRRSSLLKRLFKAEDCKLIIIEAPSGYGKTTLLGQFASESRRPTAWLTLTPDEAEAQTLSRSIATAIMFALPDLPLEGWRKASGLGAGAERLASHLATDVNLANDNLVLILEGLERLGEDAGSWLNAFLRNLGEGHQLIVSYYDEAQITFHPQLAVNDVMKLTATDLAFTAEECAEFLTLTGSDLDPATATETLGGWPAALGMAAHGAPLSASPTDLVLNILSRLPAGLREALPEAAVLETWDEATAKKIGCALPETWLAKARRGGLPMTSLGEGGYQPHGIVLNVLEQLLQQKPERHAVLHLAAARHAETNGQLLFAIDHLRIGRHHAEAFRMLEELLPRWKWRSDWSLVRKMLEPFDALPARLNTAFGLALIETRDPERGETILREQIRSDNASGWTHFGLSLLAYRRGDAEGTLEHAQDGLALVRDQRMVILLLQSKVVGLVALNKKEEALEAARECLKRAEAVGDPSLLVRGLSLMGYVLRTKGEAEASLAFGHRALDLAFSAGIPNRALAAVTDIFGYHYRKGQALEALPLVEKMLDIGKTEYPLAVPWMLRNLGYFHQQQASFEVAHGHFLEAAELFAKDGSRVEAGNCLTDVIYCLLRLGRAADAEARLPAARGFLLAADDHNQHAPYYVAEGMVRFYEGRLEAAAEAFERQKKERGEGCPVGFDNIAAVGRLAEIARRKGTLSHQLVSVLISELDKMGHDWPLGVEAQPLHELYHECVRRGWFAERFRPYLTASRVSQEPPPALLELKTFGGFRATLDGHDIPAAPKGREVLAYLALYGPSRADTVADAIWGHLDLAAARNNLKVQIRHLRAAAPATGLVRWDSAQRSYRLAPEVKVALDAHALEASIHNSQNDAQLAALDGYEGEFLCGLESEWVSQAQNRYRQMAVDLCLSLAAKAECSNPAAAIKLYHRAVDIEPFSEEAYQALVYLYEAVGNEAAARLARKALEQVLEGKDPTFRARNYN